MSHEFRLRKIVYKRYFNVLQGRTLFDTSVRPYTLLCTARWSTVGIEPHPSSLTLRLGTFFVWNRLAGMRGAMLCVLQPLIGFVFNYNKISRRYREETLYNNVMYKWTNENPMLIIMQVTPR